MKRYGVFHDKNEHCKIGFPYFCIKQNFGRFFVAKVVNMSRHEQVTEGTADTASQTAHLKQLEADGHKVSWYHPY